MRSKSLRGSECPIAETNKFMLHCIINNGIIKKGGLVLEDLEKLGMHPMHLMHHPFLPEVTLQRSFDSLLPFSMSSLPVVKEIGEIISVNWGLVW